MGDTQYASTAKWSELKSRMVTLGISESDIEENFVRGRGAGGQKINKTSSCVDILHRPSAIRVKCQKSRYRELNRFLARRELCDRMQSKISGVQSLKMQEAARERRRKARRSRKAKIRLRRIKELRSAKKEMRHPVSGNTDE